MNKLNTLFNSIGDNNIKNEAHLITKYREMALQPEAEKAIDDVCNEAIIVDDNQMPVDVDLDDTRLSPNIKNIIRTEFDYILYHYFLINQIYTIFANKFPFHRLVITNHSIRKVHNRFFHTIFSN